MHDNHFPLIANNRNDLIANSPSFMSSHRMSGIDPYTNRAYGCTDTGYELDQMKSTPSCSSYDRKKQKRMGRGRGRPYKASVGSVQGNLYKSYNQKCKTTGIVMTHPDEERIKEEMRQNKSDIGNWDSGPCDDSITVINNAHIGLVECPKSMESNKNDEIEAWLKLNSEPAVSASPVTALHIPWTRRPLVTVPTPHQQILLL